MEVAFFTLGRKRQFDERRNALREMNRLRGACVRGQRADVHAENGDWWFRPEVNGLPELEIRIDADGHPDQAGGGTRIRGKRVFLTGATVVFPHHDADG